MKVNKFSLIFALVIVLSIQCIQVASAVTSEPVLTQNNAETLSLPCTIDGNYCSTNATCKTTIINPEGNILFNNFLMTQNNAVFEVNLTSNHTSILGEYQFNVVCEDNGNDLSKFLTFHVTPNGEIPTTVNGILYVGLLAFLLVLFILLVYGFLASKTLLVKFFLFHLGYLTFTSMLFIAWNMSANYFMSVTFLTAFFRIAWWVFFVGFFPLLLGSFVWIGYMMLTIKEIDNMMERGVPESEAYARKMGGKW